MVKKVKQIIEERWKFYLVGYIIGYLIPIINDRRLDLYYLFPIKLIGFACALGIGTAFYYGSKKLPVFEIAYRAIKYIFFVIALFLIFLSIKGIIIKLTGFDITPFVGYQPEK